MEYCFLSISLKRQLNGHATQSLITAKYRKLCKRFNAFLNYTFKMWSNFQMNRTSWWLNERQN